MADQIRVRGGQSLGGLAAQEGERAGGQHQSREPSEDPKKLDGKFFRPQRPENERISEREQDSECQRHMYSCRV